MNRYFTNRANKEYLNWKNKDQKKFKKINDLIDDIEENGMLQGKGNPEQLKYFEVPTFSRRITQSDRLVYRSFNTDDILIVSCKGHYDDK